MSFSAPIFIVDAFVTESPFSGNPAAVCLLDYDDELNDITKQNIASGMNLPVTAFVAFGWSKFENTSEIKDPLKRTIRWFTTTSEIPLCGHATLASSQILFESIKSENDAESTIKFSTKFSGNVESTMTWASGLINLNFPVNPTEEIFSNDHPWLNLLISLVLGEDLSPAEVHPKIHFAPGPKFLVIQLRVPSGKNIQPSDLLKKVKPNFEKLLKFNSNGKVVSFIVTVKGGGREGEPDFYSRFFAPSIGINEDHVTGVSHTVLTSYWANELGRNEFHARQLSARGGDLFVKLQGDRVRMGGKYYYRFRGVIIFQISSCQMASRSLSKALFTKMIRNCKHGLVTCRYPMSLTCQGTFLKVWGAKLPFHRLNVS